MLNNCNICSTTLVHSAALTSTSYIGLWQSLLILLSLGQLLLDTQVSSAAQGHLVLTFLSLGQLLLVLTSLQPLRVTLFLFFSPLVSCGLWTLSCDFVPHNYERVKWLSSLPTLMQKSFWW